MTTKPNQIQFPTFLVTIKRTNRKKSIAIQVKPNSVTLLAPHRSSLQDIYQVLEKKQRWIETQLNKLPSLKSVNYQNGDIFLIQGESYTLRVKHENEAKVSKTDESIILSLPKAHDHVTYRKELLSKWYQSAAYQNMMPRFRHFQKLLNVCPNKITFGLRKSRWGSCSSKQNITINWLLVMSPQNIQDYVIVHELCHILEMNHSRRFWALVESILSDYQSSRIWLKEHGHTLFF